MLCQAIFSPQHTAIKWVFEDGVYLRFSYLFPLSCAALFKYFNHIALSEEQIAEVTTYLKKIHESESIFHTKSFAALRKEQDKIKANQSNV
jgi:hypothetical protein